jgi:hypothetical protein
MEPRVGRACQLLLIGVPGTLLVLAGCGDRIVADHNWNAVASVRTTTVQPIAGILQTTIRITGRLVTRGGNLAANTLVQETCVSYNKNGRPSLYNCQVFLNAGKTVYVAWGMVVDPLKQATGMTDPPDVGRLVVTPLGGPSAATSLRISALTGSG